MSEMMASVSVPPIRISWRMNDFSEVKVNRDFMLKAAWQRGKISVADLHMEPPRYTEERRSTVKVQSNLEAEEH